MESYTHGSTEGVQALKDALIADQTSDLHHFTLSVGERAEMTDALETAAFAGMPWGEIYTGISVHEAALWPEQLADVELDDEEILGLVDALMVASNLGDDFAAGWLSGLAECVGVEWV